MIGSVLGDINVAGVVTMMVPIVGAVALFTYLSIASYAEERRKEREAAYRYEFERKVVEQHGVEAFDRLIARKREEELAARRSSYESTRSGGFVLMGAGAGMLLGLRWIDNGVWQAGWIPLLVGAALLVYSMFAPKPNAPGSDAAGPRGPVA